VAAEEFESVARMRTRVRNCNMARGAVAIDEFPLRLFLARSRSCAAMKNTTDKRKRASREKEEIPAVPIIRK